MTIDLNQEEAKILLSLLVEGSFKGDSTFLRRVANLQDKIAPLTADQLVVDRNA